MGFKREWDESCPRIWDSWESDGMKWTIQDLPPEDDEKAIDIMVEHYIPDEVMSVAVDFINDPISVRSMVELWRETMKEHMTLVCYSEINGIRDIAAVNICFVDCLEGEKLDMDKIEGDACKHVFRTIEYAISKIDIFKYTGLDRILIGAGLCVVKNHRGKKLSTRLLAAREPLCKACGIKATETLFTGAGSQKCAERAGFTTLAVIPLKEMAEVGFRYGKDDERVMKLMLKEYD